ncbi:MAG: hypothetical protein LBK57_00175, partial [Clostridiales Family XIII bacterium]|nr:hypothetical protein [Clostridiales Family XIII bacterium]
MKQDLIIAFCLFVLIGGSLFAGSRSSYAAFVAMGETGPSSVTTADISGNEVGAAGNEAGNAGASDDGNEITGETAPDADEEKSLEDIALDKRIADQHAKNEKSFVEHGRTGSGFPSEIPTPRFGINELTDILFNTVYVYMEENPDRFPSPADNEYIGKRTFDPRVEILLYGETKGGLVSGIANENLVAWDVRQSDGSYCILVLVRDMAGGKWRILTEGDVYKLR